MSPDEQKIRETHTTWIAAVNAADLDRLLTMITDDLVLINPGRAPFGREVFTTTFSEAHQQLHLECRSDLEEIKVTGDFAYTRSHDTLSVTPRAGGPTTRLAGYRLTVYRRHPDGRWLLARDAHALAPVTG